MEVQLNNLPKRYSCADLRTITTEVLRAVGVSEALRVFPRRCERGLGANARSPAMTVRFRKAKSPGLAAGRRVRLAAGTPPALKEGDCELLRQLYFRLLSRLSLSVPEYSLACMLPDGARPAFHVTVQLPDDDVLTAQDK